MRSSKAKNVLCSKFLPSALSFVLLTFLVFSSALKINAVSKPCKEEKETRAASDNAAPLFIKRGFSMLTMIDANSITPLWKQDLGAVRILGFDENSKVVFVTLVKDEKYELITISRQSGLIEKRLDLDTIKPTVIAATDSGVLIGSVSGDLVFIDNDLKTVWRKQMSGIPTVISPFDQEQIILIGTAQGEFSKIRLNDQKTTWTANLGAQISGIEAVGNHFFVGTKIGDLFKLTATTGDRVWKRRFGGEVSRILQSKSSIYVISRDNFIYRMDMMSGDQIWKIRMKGRLAMDGVLIDEMLYIASVGSITVEEIDLMSGAKSREISVKDGAPVEDIFPFGENSILVQTDTDLVKILVCK